MRPDMTTWLRERSVTGLSLADDWLIERRQTMMDDPSKIAQLLERIV